MTGEERQLIRTARSDAALERKRREAAPGAGEPKDGPVGAVLDDTQAPTGVAVSLSPAPGAVPVLAHLPAAQPIIRRLGFGVCADSPIDLVEHVLRVAAVVWQAKRAPSNPYARATL